MDYWGRGLQGLVFLVVNLDWENWVKSLFGAGNFGDLVRLALRDLPEE